MDEKKSNKGLVVTVIILIVLLLGAVGYICYDKFMTKEDQTKDDVSDTVKLSDSEINELNDSLVINGANLYGKNINIDNIQTTQLIEYVLAKYGEENNWNQIFEKEDFDSVNTVSKDAIDSEVVKLFGVTKSLLLDDNSFYSYKSWGVKFSSSDNKFYLDPSSMGMEFDTLRSNLVKYEQTENELYLYNKIVNCWNSTGICRKPFVESSHGEDVIVSNTKIDSVNALVDSEIMKDSIDFDYVFQKYSDKLDTYKTVFKKAGDGKYYWYSSEIVNE